LGSEHDQQKARHDAMRERHRILGNALQQLRELLSGLEALV
jgi:hypothetical protein